MKFTVSKNGKPFTDYTWDEKTKTFSSDANGLVIDMSELSRVTIKCGWHSTIKCKGYSTIKCKGYSTMRCGYGSTIKCGGNSTIKCEGNSTITADGEFIVVIRWDCEDFYRLDSQTIKTNEYGVVGYEAVDEKKIITIDGKDIELSKESYEALVAELVKDEGEENVFKIDKTDSGHMPSYDKQKSEPEEITDEMIDEVFQPEKIDVVGEWPEEDTECSVCRGEGCRHCDSRCIEKKEDNYALPIEHYEGKGVVEQMKEEEKFDLLPESITEICGFIVDDSSIYQQNKAINAILKRLGMAEGEGE
jgi:hypothetical protein